MKTTILKRVAGTCCAAVALALIAGCASSSSSDSAYRAPTSARGGSTGLTQLQPIRTGADVAALQEGDAVVMSCPKCKNVTVTHITKENKPGQTSTAYTSHHLCPGCNDKVAMKGHGRSATEHVTHTCSNCGSTDAFCCVMKKGQGPTAGMPAK